MTPKSGKKLQTIWNSGFGIEATGCKKDHHGRWRMVTIKGAR